MLARKVWPLALLAAVLVGMASASVPQRPRIIVVQVPRAKVDAVAPRAFVSSWRWPVSA